MLIDLEQLLKTTDKCVCVCVFTEHPTWCLDLDLFLLFFS